MIDIGDADRPEFLTAEGLIAELADLMDSGKASSWLAEAVMEAVANDDIIFLKRQVRIHVPGWTL